MVLGRNQTRAGLMSEEPFTQPDELPPPVGLVVETFGGSELCRRVRAFLAGVTTPADEDHEEDERAPERHQQDFPPRQWTGFSSDGGLGRSVNARDGRQRRRRAGPRGDRHSDEIGETESKSGKY